MITADERQKLEELKSQIPCAKHFTCVEAALAELCNGEYHADLDLLECLEKTDPPCTFARAFGCTSVCLCPLRKYIARNLNRWSANSTTHLRQSAPPG